MSRPRRLVSCEVKPKAKLRKICAKIWSFRGNPVLSNFCCCLKTKRFDLEIVITNIKPLIVPLGWAVSN